MNKLLDIIHFGSLELLFSIFIFFIWYVGGFDLFTLWNCIPVVLGYLVIKYTSWKGRPLKRIMFIVGFSIFSTGVTIFIHLAWIFDLFDIATGSSTSALIFLFLPPYSLAFGCIGALMGWLLGWGITLYASKFRT